MDSRERLLSRQEEARPVPVQRPERPAEEGARNEVPRPQSHPDREKREEVNYVSQHSQDKRLNTPAGRKSGREHVESFSPVRRPQYSCESGELSCESGVLRPNLLFTVLFF